jgi:pimeloyl-ACP methyl ester carboxylesterase
VNHSNCLYLIAKKSKPLPQTPLLVVGAEQDAFFHVAAQRETAAHLSANFLLAHNSGHDVMLDAAADAVPQQIIEWLKITLAK